MTRLFMILGLMALTLSACGSPPISARALELRNEFNNDLKFASHYAQDNPNRCSPTVPPPCGDQRLINEASAAQEAAMEDLATAERLARDADAAASNPLAKAPSRDELSAQMRLAQAKVDEFKRIVAKMRDAVKTGRAH